LGAEQLAEHLKDRIEKAKAETVDGEDRPLEVPEERQEADLASQVALPQGSGENPAATPDQQA
jgi:hypothetical protein